MLFGNYLTRDPMIEIYDLIGRERPLTEVANTIHSWAQAQNAAEVGALQVTCSDESERECVEALQHGFTDHLLPTLKFARRSAFQLSNLGGRYEWGAAPLAEEHFLSQRSQLGFTLLVAKLNAHVAFEDIPNAAAGTASFRMGVWKRYGRDSTSCGALNALVANKRAPFLDDLRETFESEGHDRLGALRDSQRVSPLFRPLAAATVSARLQARKLVLDLQDHAPAQSTYWIVLPCVTVNRHAQDTEIVCGVYAIDSRDGERKVTYSGLGDDAAVYRIEHADDRLTVIDDHVGITRSARDHRKMIQSFIPSLPHDTRDVLDARLNQAYQDNQNNSGQRDHQVRELLKRVLPIHAEVAPAAAAALVFTHGIAAMHHASTIHTLSDPKIAETRARLILDEVYDQIDDLDDRTSERLLELLLHKSDS